jgi:hypothetical protein
MNGIETRLFEKTELDGPAPYTHVIFRMVKQIRKTGVKDHVMAKLGGRIGPFSSARAAVEAAALAGRKLGLSADELLKYMTRMREIRSGPFRSDPSYPGRRLRARMRARPGRICSTNITLRGAARKSGCACSVSSHGSSALTSAPRAAPAAAASLVPTGHVPADAAGIAPRAAAAGIAPRAAAPAVNLRGRH